MTEILPDAKDLSRWLGEARAHTVRRLTHEHGKAEEHSGPIPRTQKPIPDEPTRGKHTIPGEITFYYL
ncbi:MAG: hypothetical protein WAW63_00785 [Candidatus Saccharimonadales bacterium]